MVTIYVEHYSESRVVKEIEERIGLMACRELKAAKERKDSRKRGTKLFKVTIKEVILKEIPSE